MDKNLHGKDLVELLVEQVAEGLKDGSFKFVNPHYAIDRINGTIPYRGRVSSDDIAYQEWCEFYEINNRGVEENGL